jgi:hypothetical protein
MVVRRVVMWVSIAFVGAVLGGSIVMIGTRQVALSAEPSSNHSAAQQGIATAIDPVIESRIARLERSNQERSISTGGHFAQDRARPMPEDSSERPPSTEATKARIAQAIANRESQFSQEYFDSAWSPVAAAALTKTLEGLQAAGKFSLDRVECKVALCRAQIRWPSYSEALENWKQIIHADIGMQCQSEMSVPAPETTGEPYVARAFFDCADERAK